MKKPLQILVVLFLVCTYACKKEEEVTTTLVLPKTFSFDINADDTLDFETVYPQFVIDGAGFSGLGTSASIRSLNRERNYLLGFFAVTDTIKLDTGIMGTGRGRRIHLASIVQYSHDNFQVPEKWEVNTPEQTAEAFIGDQLVDHTSEVNLGWMKVRVNDREGSITLLEVEPPVQADFVVVK